MSVDEIAAPVEITEPAARWIHAVHWRASDGFRTLWAPDAA